MKKWETYTGHVMTKTPGDQANFCDDKNLAEGKTPGKTEKYPTV
jgi:hypothetical protein